MKLIRKEKLEKAKEMKNSNRLIRENILILKSKLLDHNKQLNKLVKHEKELSKNTIEKIKEEKKKFYMDIKLKELEKEKNGVELKENELNYWKHQYESLLFSPYLVCK